MPEPFKADEDSAYVFEKLCFNTSLPSFHLSSTTKGPPKRPMEDYFAEIPKALIEKVYAKYYLDFVLLGFSSEMVSKFYNLGTDQPSNYKNKMFYIKEAWHKRSSLHRKHYQFFFHRGTYTPALYTGNTYMYI